MDGVDFRAYPGFEWFPYAEYSDVFYGGDYKVLRGGSWATAPERRAHDVPQLGPPHPPADLRRLPHALEGRLMCRHLAYLGPPRSLASLLYEPEQSLEKQSWKPRASATAP